MWNFNGKVKPSFAIEPKDGEESVWDYPRPPSIQRDSRTVLIILNGNRICETRKALKVMETASPPSFYIPRSDIDLSYLKINQEVTFCEWKGMANYYGDSSDSELKSICWYYPNPKSYFTSIKDHLAFYPARVDCFINNEKVNAQKGGFYGGWVTKEIIGPFKGDDQTLGW